MTTTSVSTPAPGLLLAVLALFALGCGPSPELEPDRDTEPRPEGESTPDPEDRRFLREIAFVGPSPDSAISVAWRFETRQRGDETDRHAEGVLTRGGAWETFFSDTTPLPADVSPWLVVPRGPFSVIASDAGDVETLAFSDPPRELETVLGPTRAEWSGSRGEVYRLLEGSIGLADESLDGWILEMTRSWTGVSESDTDWMFLVSEDGPEVVIDGPGPASAEEMGLMRAWVRIDFRELRWSELTVTWPEVRALVAARRDIPRAWDFATPDSAFVGSVRALSEWAEALDSESPMPPIRGLYRVVGEVEVNGERFEVFGLVRLAQP